MPDIVSFHPTFSKRVTDESIINCNKGFVGYDEGGKVACIPDRLDCASQGSKICSEFADCTGRRLNSIYYYLFVKFDDVLYVDAIVGRVLSVTAIHAFESSRQMLPSIA